MKVVAAKRAALLADHDFDTTNLRPRDSGKVDDDGKIYVHTRAGDYEVLNVEPTLAAFFAKQKEKAAKKAAGGGR